MFDVQEESSSEFIETFESVIKNCPWISEFMLENESYHEQLFTALSNGFNAVMESMGIESLQGRKMRKFISEHRLIIAQTAKEYYEG